MRRAPRLRVVVRSPFGRSRLPRMLTGSLAAHGLLLAAIVIVPMARRSHAPMDDAMVVALAGPLPGPPAAAAPAAPAAAAPPAPAPVAPPPKEAHVVKDVPKPAVKTDKPVPKKKEEKDVPAKPPPEAPAATPSPVGGAGTGPPGAHPGAGAAAATGVTAVLGNGDASLGYYQAAVKAALEAKWIPPPLEDQQETYSVAVAFVILRDGTVRDVRIAQESGVPSLDRSALRAVVEASPLPPVPPSWTGDTLPATMRFDLKPESR